MLPNIITEHSFCEIQLFNSIICSNTVMSFPSAFLFLSLLFFNLSVNILLLDGHY